MRFVARFRIARPINRTLISLREFLLHCVTFFVTLSPGDRACARSPSMKRQERRATCPQPDERDERPRPHGRRRSAPRADRPGGPGSGESPEGRPAANRRYDEPGRLNEQPHTRREDGGCGGRPRRLSAPVLDDPRFQDSFPLARALTGGVAAAAMPFTLMCGRSLTSLRPARRRGLYAHRALPRA